MRPEQLHERGRHVAPVACLFELDRALATGEPQLPDVLLQFGGVAERDPGPSQRPAGRVVEGRRDQPPRQRLPGELRKTKASVDRELEFACRSGNQTFTLCEPVG